MGDEEDSKDKEWLSEVREEFPEEIIPKEWYKQQSAGQEGGIKERLRNARSVLEAFSPRRQAEKIRTSTPEDAGKRKREGETREEKREEREAGAEEKGKAGEEK